MIDGSNLLVEIGIDSMLGDLPSCLGNDSRAATISMNSSLGGQHRVGYACRGLAYFLPPWF